MVRLFSLIIFASLFFSFALVDTKAQDTNALVIKIREHYAQINKLTRTYRKVKKDAEGFSLEGGEMTAYFSGKQVMKIAAIFYGESGRSTADFYFWDGKLIFVFQKRFNYDKPMSGKVVSTEENRYYFNEGTLIKWVEGKKDKNVNDDESKETGASWIEDANKLIELANS